MTTRKIFRVAGWRRVICGLGGHEKGNEVIPGVLQVPFYPPFETLRPLGRGVDAFDGRGRLRRTLHGVAISAE